MRGPGRCMLQPGGPSPATYGHEGRAVVCKTQGRGGYDAVKAVPSHSCGGSNSPSAPPGGAPPRDARRSPSATALRPLPPSRPAAAAVADAPWPARGPGPGPGRGRGRGRPGRRGGRAPRRWRACHGSCRPARCRDWAWRTSSRPGRRAGPGAPRWPTRPLPWRSPLGARTPSRHRGPEPLNSPAGPGAPTGSGSARRVPRDAGQPSILVRGGPDPRTPGPGEEESAANLITAYGRGRVVARLLARAAALSRCFGGVTSLDFNGTRTRQAGHARA